MSSPDPWEEADKLKIGRRNAEERRLDADILCSRCTWGHLYRRRRRLQYQVYCGFAERDVPADIVECSKFRDVNTMSLPDMIQIAVPIDARPGIDDRSYR